MEPLLTDHVPTSTLPFTVKTSRTPRRLGYSRTSRLTDSLPLESVNAKQRVQFHENNEKVLIKENSVLQCEVNFLKKRMLVYSNEKVSQMEHENWKIKDFLTTMEEALHLKEAQREEAQNKSEQMAQRMNSLDRRMAGLNQDLKTARSEVIRAKGEITQIKSENFHLISKMKELEESGVLLVQKVKRLEEQRAILSSERHDVMLKLKPFELKVDELEEENKSLKLWKTQNSNKVISLKEKQHNQNNKMELLDKQAAEYKGTINGLNETITELQKTIENLNKKLVDYDLLQESLEESQVAFSQARKNMLMKTTKLENDLYKATQVASEARRICTEATDKMDDLKKQLAMVQANWSMAKKALSSLEEEHAMLHKSFEQTQNTLELKTIQIKQNEAEITTLNEQIYETTYAKREAEYKMQEAIDDVARVEATLQLEIERRKDMQKHNDELVEKHAEEMKEMKDELDELIEKECKLRIEHEQANINIASLAEDLKESRSQNNDLRLNLDYSRKELKSALDSLTREKNLTSGMLHQFNTLKETEKLRHEKMEIDLGKANASVIKLTSTNNILEAQNKKLIDELEKSELHGRNVDEMLLVSEKARKAAEEQATTYVQELQEARSSMDNINRAAAQRIRTAFEASLRDVNNLKEIITQLKKENKSLKQ